MGSASQHWEAYRGEAKAKTDCAIGRRQLENWEVDQYVICMVKHKSSLMLNIVKYSHLAGLVRLWASAMHSRKRAIAIHHISIQEHSVQLPPLEERGDFIPKASCWRACLPRYWLQTVIRGPWTWKLCSSSTSGGASKMPSDFSSYTLVDRILNIDWARTSRNRRKVCTIPHGNRIWKST